MKKDLLSIIVFLSCLIISIISFLSLIFPKLLVEIAINDPLRDTNLFELGILSIPILVMNIIFFSFLGLNKIGVFGDQIKKKLDKIRDYDISRRTSLVIIIFLLSIYSVFTVDELNREEFELADYFSVKEIAQNYDLEDLSPLYSVRFILLGVSDSIFDNLKIIPFLASISLLFLTYFLTLQLTKKRLSSIIAFGILLQSNLFLIFDTTATYENFWTAFYFFSLYLILRKPVGSPGSFVLGLLSKPLVVTLMPVNWYLIFSNKNKITHKKFIISTYAIISGLILVLLVSGNFATFRIELDIMKFLVGINEFGNSLRFDGLILLLFFPVMVLLASQIGKTKNDVTLVFVGILFAIISQPIMYAVIGMSMQPYRYIPFIVFCAIGIGMVFSNTKKED